MRIDIERQSKELSATINSLCREEAILSREELMALLDSITASSIRIVKPMRDAGIIKLRKEGSRGPGTYTFLKQEVPIHWKVFYNILLRARDRKRVKIIKEKVHTEQPIRRSYDTWVIDSTDSRYTYI